MDIQTVEATAQPMVYVSRDTTMAPGAIAKTVGEAFGTLGAILGMKGILPAGPPLAVYRMGDAGKVSVDIGFPVAKDALPKSNGVVKAGDTPGGRAVAATHHGPYDTIQGTCAAMSAYMEKNGLPMPSLSWEVYLSDPRTTAPQDMVTQVYFPIVAV